MAARPRGGLIWALALLVSPAAVPAGVEPASAAAVISSPPRDGIEVIAPTQARRTAVYDVTISGFSRRRARAYLFIDYQGCAKSFSVEQSRAASQSGTYAVKGSFARTSGWRSSQTGVDHACAYLVSSAGSVLAAAKRSYRVS